MKDYKIKYLKYKNKYLELKKLLGGSTSYKDERICTNYLKNKCKLINRDRCNNGIHITREMIDSDPEMRLCQECGTTPFCEKICDSCVRNKQIVQDEINHTKLVLSDLEKKIIVAQKLVDEKNAAKVQSKINKTRMGTSESLNEYQIIKKETSNKMQDLLQLQKSKNDIKKQLNRAITTFNIDCDHKCQCDQCKYGNCPNKENCIRSHNIDRRILKLQEPPKVHIKKHKDIEKTEPDIYFDTPSDFPTLEPSTYVLPKSLNLPPVTFKKIQQYSLGNVKQPVKSEPRIEDEFYQSNFDDDFDDIKSNRNRKMGSREIFVQSLQSEPTRQSLQSKPTTRLKNSDKTDWELLDYIDNLIHESNDNLELEMKKLEGELPANITKGIVSNIDYGINDIEELGRMYLNIKKQIDRMPLCDVPDRWEDIENIDLQISCNQRNKLIVNLNIIRYTLILKKINNSYGF